MSRHTSDSKQRARKKYRELHDQLRKEVAADLYKHLNPKRRRARIRADYWRAYAETME